MVSSKASSKASRLAGGQSEPGIKSDFELLSEHDIPGHLWMVKT